MKKQANESTYDLVKDIFNDTPAYILWWSELSNSEKDNYSAAYFDTRSSFLLTKEDKETIYKAELNLKKEQNTPSLPLYMLWWEGLDFLELDRLTTKYWLTPIEDIYKAEYPLLNKETKGSEVGYTGEWEYEPSSNDVDFLIYSPNNLMPVFMTCEDGLALHYQNKELAEQNAQLIVKAVNNHDALVSALKEVTECMTLDTPLAIQTHKKILTILNKIEANKH